MLNNIWISQNIGNNKIRIGRVSRRSLDEEGYDEIQINNLQHSQKVR